jgi:signal transduction histidine kinase
MDINTCFATTADYRDLALYSHLIPAIATLILGLFAYARASDRIKAMYFLAFASMLTVWLVADLVVWTSNSYSVVAAFWGPLDYVEITFFLLLFAFIFTDAFPRYSSWLQPSIIVAAIVPAAITLSGNAVYEMNQSVCEMIGNDFLANYKIWLEIIVLAATLVIGVLAAMRPSATRDERIRLALIIPPVVLFMGIFAGSEYIATATDIFEINLYALFTLPVFVLALTIAITSYGTFKLGAFAVRVLFYVFLVLAATQYFFVGDMKGFLLASMSFGVVLTLGILLFKTSERETRLRIQIQKQEEELEVVNKQQENLLHFISHEIKGYLTDGQNAFAGLVEGDFGFIPGEAKAMSEKALARMRDGVTTVMNILDASNLKKGTVSYKKETFDFRELVRESVEHMRPRAMEKNLILDWTVDGDADYTYTGDKEKIREHVVRNLIDNAIRYTLEGEIHVRLSDGKKMIHFAVKDTGVGITKEDRPKLFTEGGHGKDSIKVNVDSTGYGLFIAKQVTEAHGGTIRAESEGAGRGSEFIVELPVTVA